MISQTELPIIEEFAGFNLDPAVEFILNSNFPDDMPVEFYTALIKVFFILGLSMTCTQDLRQLDNWVIFTAKKIKKLNSELKDEYIN